MGAKPSRCNGAVQFVVPDSGICPLSKRVYDCDEFQSHSRFAMRKMLLCLILFSIALCSPLSHARSSGSRHSSSSSSSSSHRSSSSSKPVHVRGYTKKDGTYVAPHDRSAPGTADHNSPSPSAYHAPSTSPYSHPYRNGHLASGYAAHQSVHLGSNGKIKRSAAAKDAFKRQHPCPANGHASGSCPGYVIDHVSPLECGGADDPSNMQWQTVADGKAKDKTERYCR